MGRIYNEALGKKIAGYYQQRLGCREYQKGWMKGTCPSCGKHDKFGINISQARTNCFYCEEHPNPIELILQVEGFSTHKEVYNHLNTFEDADYLQPAIEIYDYKIPKLPEGFRLISLGKSSISDLARGYLKGRGFKISELELKGVGYCSRGEYMGYIIFPFYQRGRLIYYTTRRFIQVGSKFKNPKIEDFGIGKSSIIYNIDALGIYRKIRIVESVTNALTLGNNAIAIDGKIVSKWQLSAILRSPVELVEIILDRDAYKAALKMGMDIVNEKRVRVVLMPDEQDVNDVGRKKTKRIIKATQWVDYKSLYKGYINAETA